MNPKCALPRILIVERDDELRDIITTLLQEEGYEVHATASLENALKLLDKQVFSLALVDLFIRHSRPAFTEGHILRRRARPIPVGLLTTQRLAPEEAARQGFAFLLHEPFEIENLLALVAAAINQPFSQEQQQQAETIQRFFVALQNSDWQTIAALCTENVTYYPPARSPFAPTRKIQGLTPYRQYIEDIKQRLSNTRFHAIMIFARPKGLAARYQISWTMRNQHIPQHIAGTTLFHFQGKTIAQIGISLNSDYLQALINKRQSR